MNIFSEYATVLVNATELLKGLNSDFLWFRTHHHMSHLHVAAYTQ